MARSISPAFAKLWPAKEKEHDRVRLQAANLALEPILIPKSVWDREWQVQGKVIAIFRKFTDNEITDSPPLIYPVSEERTDNTIDNVHKLIKENSNELKELINQLKAQIQTMATLFYRQAKDANKRLDDFYEKLIEIEEINRAVELALTCSEDMQDQYKGLIIFRRLGLHIKEQEIPILDLLAKKKSNT